MKKPDLIKFDLDKVYFMDKYNKTLTYGQKNVHIDGVKEQLQKLESEKKLYYNNVAGIVDPERENNEIKYQKYEKWAKLEKKFKLIEILLIVLFIIQLLIFDHLPVGFRSSLIFSLFSLLLMLFSVFIGPLVFIITKIIKHIHGMCYKQYIKSIDSKLKNIGNNFKQISTNYYKTIDNLYLRSLDDTHRELVLLRRQQEAQNQEMLLLEIERQKIEKERLDEQRRARAASEKLLAIEQEREKRWRGW